MAFCDLELQTIESTVGALCRRRSPSQFSHELRFVHEVEGHSVSVFEERPPWRHRGEWTRKGIARFRYVRSRGTWTLYWMRQDLKWHVYEPEPPSRGLAKLVGIVEEDKHGAFFG